MASTGGVKIGSSYDEARTRKVNAEAEIAELDLAKARGEIVIADHVVSAWSETLMNMKSKLIAVPSKAAPIMATIDNAGECQSILDEMIREALEELTSYEPRIDPTSVKSSSRETEGSNSSPEAAPKTERKRVGRPRKTTGLTK